MGFLLCSLVVFILELREILKYLPLFDSVSWRLFIIMSYLENIIISFPIKISRFLPFSMTHSLGFSLVDSQYSMIEYLKDCLSLLGFRTGFRALLRVC